MADTNLVFCCRRRGGQCHHRASPHRRRDQRGWPGRRNGRQPVWSGHRKILMFSRAMDAAAHNQLRDRLTIGGLNGRVDVAVTFDGASAGMTATARVGGIAADPTTEVGYAFPGFAH
jgi:hypothetical protein